jgi:hypothetical protein
MLKVLLYGLYVIFGVCVAAAVIIFASDLIVKLLIYLYKLIVVFYKLCAHKDATVEPEPVAIVTKLPLNAYAVDIKIATVIEIK